MSDKENDKDIDEDALAALVRPSAASADGAADEDDEDDDDEDVLDLRALAASMAPPEPEADAADDDEADDDEADDDDEAAASASEAGGSEKPAAKKKSTKKKSTKKKSTKKKSAKKAPEKSSEERSRPAAAVAEPAPKNNTMLYGVIVAAAAAVLIVYMVTQNGDAQPTGEVASAPPTSVQAPDDPSGVESGSSFDEQEEPEALDIEESGDIEEPMIDEAATTEAAPTPAAAAAARRPRTAGGARTATTTEAPATPAMEATTTTMAAAAAMAPTMETATGGGLDSVLDMALGGRPAEGGTRTVATMDEAPAMAAAPSGNLPATPSRGDVARTLGRLMPQIRQCAGEQVGLANATILVRSDGSPASVSIGGNPFGGTPQGACMEGVLRRAQFSPFRQSTFRVNYPFAIRAAN